MTSYLRFLTLQHIHFFLIAVAATALGAAYVAEYGFNVLPCDFCLYERRIYAAILIIGILSLKTQTLAGHRGVIAQLIALFTGIVLTFYHVGMEQHWWAGPASCTGISNAATLEEFRAHLMEITRPRCDQASWVILGISATLWNLMLQAGLAFLTSLSLYLSPNQTRGSCQHKKS
jgi:disulfide bond formation protein DsbB